MSLFIGLVSEGIAYASLISIPDPAVAGLFFISSAIWACSTSSSSSSISCRHFRWTGGRVLRALLAIWLPIEKATRIAAEIGRVIAIIFGILGLISFNIILILIAVFIYLGAGQEVTMIRYTQLLAGVKVRDAMTTPVTTVVPDMPVTEAMNLMYSTRHLGFPVVDRGSLSGMVTLHDIQNASDVDRDALQVRDIMTREVITITPDHDLYDALKILAPPTPSAAYRLLRTGGDGYCHQNRYPQTDGDTGGERHNHPQCVQTVAFRTKDTDQAASLLQSPGMH